MPKANFATNYSGSVGNDAGNDASGTNAATIAGMNNVASGPSSATVGGNGNIATGIESIAGGSASTATGAACVALGDGCTAGPVNGATSLGSDTFATAAGAFASGFDCRATGTCSSAMGSASSAPNRYESALGFHQWRGGVTYGYFQRSELGVYNLTTGSGPGETVDLKKNGPFGTEIPLLDSKTYQGEINWVAVNTAGTIRRTGRIVFAVKCEAGVATLLPPGPSEPADEQWVEPGAETWSLTVSTAGNLLRFRFSTGTTTMAGAIGGAICWTQVDRVLS